MAAETSTTSTEAAVANGISSSDFTNHGDEYDIIIVGGGTAGLVVAARLSEANLQVLVLEAGQNQVEDPRIQIPGLALSLWQDPNFDWCFKTVPQEHLNGRVINHIGGKTLGGSSALNIGLVAYPSQADLDGWQQLGNPGWDWQSMLPYYRKFHTFHPPSPKVREMLGLAYLKDSQQGQSGPIQVSFGEGQSPCETSWPETFKNLGLKMDADILSGHATGGQSNPGSIDPSSGTRSFAASAYYTPEVAGRENLTLITEAFVEKIILEKSNKPESDLFMATAVQFVAKSGERVTVRARREVILATGTMQSSQLLELSGIGSADLLRSKGIEIVVDNPSVGEGLQDHLVGSLSFEVKDDVPSADAFRDPKVLEAVMGLYQATKGGPLAASTYSTAYTPVSAFSGAKGQAELEELLAQQAGVQNSDPSHTTRDELLLKTIKAGDKSSAQYCYCPFQINTHDYANGLKPITPGNYMSIMVALSHPLSRGSVHVTSADPRIRPAIDPRYLSNPLDKEILARHIHWIATLVKTEPWASLLKESGGRIPPGLDVESLEAAREQTKRSITNFHPVGTCAMLPRQLGGVVNERLSVYGTEGLRVVDASIMPLIPRGNIQSSVYAIAEKAADIIKEDIASS